MRILGIDPGYAIVGYGFVDYHKSKLTPVDFGAVTTPAGMPFGQRLEIIFRQMNLMLDHMKPDAMGIEKLFFTNNQKTGIDVAQARGVIMLAASMHNVPIFEYTPLQVKQGVVGYGLAEKKQVMEMTKRLLGLAEVPKPDDTADALAIAICHAHAGSSLRSKYMTR